jgi:hypothetical protein
LLCKPKKASFAPAKVILGKVKKLPKGPKVAKKKTFFFSEFYQARKKMKIRGRKKKDFFLFNQEKAKHFLFFDYLFWKVQSAF